MITDDQAQRERQREKDGFWLGVKTTLVVIIVIGALIICFNI